MTAPSDRILDLRIPLDTLRDRYNHRKFIDPDPLQFVHEYEDSVDREIVGLIASALAFGNVKQIVRSVRAVLNAMKRPSYFVTTCSRSRMERTFDGFRHRYVDGAAVASVLYASGRMVEEHGSLGRRLANYVKPQDEDLVAALTLWVDELRGHSNLKKCYLLPSPADGSACKRLNLYLRWMVRQDEVDPGGWPLPTSLLVVPLDTHMHRIALSLGLTKRRQADLAAAREVTDAFCRIAPEDPVRYDFALTRLGIRTDGDVGEFLRDCAVSVGRSAVGFGRTAKPDAQR